MSVLEPAALAESPLADLHAIASELGIDGFRRLRKEDLIDAIVARQGGEGGGSTADSDAGDDAERDERPRRRRGGRGRDRDRDRDRDEAEPVAATAPAAPSDADADDENEGSRRRRRGRGRDRDERRGGAEAQEREAKNGNGNGEAEGSVEGVVDLLGNGSGFVRVAANGEAGEGDVYISAAQVRRCELVAGDKVTGPVRPPRRSERHPSLVRVDTINGRPADETAGEGTRFDDLPAAFPAERFAFAAQEPTVKAIEWLTPIGKGSRVTIVGGPRAGKTETLRRLGEHLARLDGLELSLVLAGVRPEEIAEAAAGPVEPAASHSFAATTDALSQAVERAIDNGKKIAARGGHAVVLIDTLDGVHPGAARKALAAARNVADGGSLTVIATASEPVGGETTVVALDADLTATGHFPAIDLAASGTLRPELLLGDAGAKAIAKARTEATR